MIEATTITLWFGFGVWVLLWLIVLGMLYRTASKETLIRVRRLPAENTLRIVPIPSSIPLQELV